MNKKKDRPLKMMTTKDDYDHKPFNDYLNELLAEIERKKQLPSKK